jgi:hypothetical protein
MDKFFAYVPYYFSSLNNSKFFTGLVILMMNIGSKYVTIELSKSQEEYIKYNLAREFLIFSMVWMSTRDIITSFLVTAAFIILADYLLNENCKYCILPNKYKYVLNKKLPVEEQITESQLNQALQILEKAKKQEELKKQAEFLHYFNNNK